jgi:FixJ family two-component response regulator
MCTFGYRAPVADAPSAIELDRLERDHCDALVMDLKLPDAAGRATLENACARAGQLPVVVLTSTDDEGLALDAIRGGAEDYLVKQRTHALSLPGVVRRAIERHRRNGARPTGARPAVALVDRSELREQIARALVRARRRHTAVAVMVAGYVDLDWLAEAFVPAAIDRLGARAAEQLALHARTGNRVARIDAARFAVVLEGEADRGQLEGIAQGLRIAMQRVEIELDRGVAVGLEARVGVARFPEDGSDPANLLARALTAWRDADPQGGIGFPTDVGAQAGKR